VLTVDPVTLEVVGAALTAITNEMSHVLQRTSYNMMIFEIRDFCCAIVDREGSLVSQNLGGVSHFIADLGIVIQDGVQTIPDFQPGDVIVTNHQAIAGQHLNNVCVYMPFFFEGELIGFPIVRAHWIDVGGMSTGFGAATAVRDPWMEGLQLDQVRVYRAGVPNTEILKLIRDNIRHPESSMGDLRAQIAACQLAVRRLEELFGKYGKAVALRCIQQLFADSEAHCRRVVEQMPDGEYVAESYFGQDEPGQGTYLKIKARVTIAGGDMTIDLRECSPQTDGPYNSRTFAAAYIAYKAITAPLEPVNEGSFRALKVVIPEGSFMTARYPAPMPMWSLPLPPVVDTILSALAQAIPDEVPAGQKGLGDAVTFFGVDPRTGKRFVAQGTEGGGWGGRPFEDGESASVSVCQGDVRNAPIESLEAKFPVLVEARELRPDSGGAGQFRGGLGLDVRVRNLVAGRWNLVQTGGKPRPPFGLWGGKPGDPSDKLLQLPTESDWRSVDASWYDVPANTRAIVRSAGGGGWGDPLARDPARVLSDVEEGFVSLPAARREYGVVLQANGDALAIDTRATEELRAALRAERTD
jgi:N-methylhydantoinase B